MQQEMCTNGPGSMITVGGTSATAIDSMTVHLKDCEYNESLTVNSYILFSPASSSCSILGGCVYYSPKAQWQGEAKGETCTQKLTVGVQGGGGLPRVDAIDLSIKQNDCASCSAP